MLDYPSSALMLLADFVWSLSNDVILSVSQDGTARLWDVAAGRCMRVIEDGSGGQLLTCLFHPLNNNMFVVSSFFSNFFFMIFLLFFFFSRHGVQFDVNAFMRVFTTYNIIILQKT